MLIGVEKRFIFVSNTKAASTSVEHLLMPYTEVVCLGNSERKHRPMKKVLTSFPFLFDQPKFQPESFFRFGVMRHPLEWIQSWYRYRKGNQVADPLTENMGFSAFWARKDWNIQRQDGTKYLQSQMFCADDGQVLVDVIIPYARLNEMLGEICGNLKIVGKLEQKNASILGQTDSLPDSLKSEMEEFYVKDLELFDRLDQINAVGMQKLREMAP